MGWSQGYSKTDNTDLFEKITGIKVEDLLAAELKKMGIVILKREEITLSEDMYGGDFKGEKVHLNDGRILQHKLAASYHGDDQGHDHFAWFEEDEIPQVTKTHDEESADPEDTKFDDGKDDDDVPVVN